MTGRLKNLTKVIQRRIAAGEKQDTVLANYLLTDSEKAEIIAELAVTTSTTA
ncbi:MAG: hypothetical protein LKJ17_07185 [Oscillospiraceae bacterium]|jgi:hypothetical protein|nr:hypothetical protein [Oscillospiraceae bacterium]